MRWPEESKQQKMAHCQNTFRLHHILTLHTHTCTLSHTFFSHLFPRLNHTVQLKQVGPVNHMAFHTEHADTSTAQRASLWCCVDYKWCGEEEEEEEGDRLLAAEQVGMQLFARLVCQWMGKWGWGWVGAVLSGTFTPKQAVTKVAKWCHSHCHTQAGPLYPLHQQNNKRGWGGRNEDKRKFT